MLGINIEKIAERIREKDELLKNVGKSIREFDLFEKVNKEELGDIVIGGEDSGVIKKQTHLIDIVFIRAISTLFKYNNSKLSEVRYYPSPNPSPVPKVVPEGLSEFEFNLFWSLERLKEELNIAISTIQKFSPDFFLIDGSLIIHPSDIPKKESLLYKTYEEVQRKFLELYELGKEKNCIILGIVEDSRSSNYCNYLIKTLFSEINTSKADKIMSILSHSRDTHVLNYALKVGEKTKSLPLTKEVSYFYIKVVEFDRPLRIEFLSRDNEEKIAEKIFALCCKNKRFAIPNVLIECDLRAKLSQEQVDRIFRELSSLTGLGEFLFLRRDIRPF